MYVAVLKRNLIFAFLSLLLIHDIQASFDVKEFEKENLSLEIQSNDNINIPLEEAVEQYLEEQVDHSKSKIFSKDKYNIKGAYQSYITEECHYTSLSKILNQSNFYLSNKGKNLQAWVDRCQDELSRFTKGAVSNLVRFSTVKYPINQNSKLQYVQFNYDNNSSVVRGILGIKDNKKRPLIIVKNGLYGEANESSISKNFFMHLFDESPFHVLLLGNMTGKDFLRDNGRVGLGGYDEGRQVHEVMDQVLNDEAYKGLIEDVHMVGASLGGNAALFSSLYSSYKGHFTNKFKSVIAVCPVVDLQKSYSYMFSNSVVGIANGAYAYKHILDIYDDVPILGQFLKKGRYWSKSDISKAIVGSSTEFYKEKTALSPWGYLPFEFDIVKNVQDFWDKNNFVSFAEEINVPTLVLHSDDDPIVRNKNNAQILSQSLENKNSQVAVVNFKSGGHCGYNVANGWPTMSTMLREFILSHSSYRVENKIDRGDLYFDADVKKESEKVKNFKFVKYEWKATKNKTTVDLKITYFDPQHKFLWFNLCDKDYRKANPSECFYSKTYKVHLSSFKSLNVPSNDYEVNALTRWLNTYVTPMTARGDYPYGRSLLPTTYYSHFY